MPRPFIEDRATRAPAKCVISGAGDGPIINTGRRYGEEHPRGTIYVSVGAIAHLLHDLGWADPKKTVELTEGAKTAKAELAEAEKGLGKLTALRDAVAGLVETPTPEVQFVEKIVQRDPTPEEVKTFISENPNHPVVAKLQRPEKGSREEWEKLYGKKGPQTDAQKQKTKNEEDRAASKARHAVARADTQVDSEPEGENDPKAPMKVVQLHGQDVDLDELLSGTVKQVTAVMDGQPTEFQQAVAMREVYLRSQEDKQPRSTLMSAIDTEDDNE